MSHSSSSAPISTSAPTPSTSTSLLACRHCSSIGCTSLECRLALMSAELKLVKQQKELLQAVLKIAVEDCSLKNEQFESLYTNLSLSHAWRDVHVDIPALQPNDMHKSDHTSITHKPSIDTISISTSPRQLNDELPKQSPLTTRIPSNTSSSSSSSYPSTSPTSSFISTSYPSISSSQYFSTLYTGMGSSMPSHARPTSPPRGDYTSTSFRDVRREPVFRVTREEKKREEDQDQIFTLPITTKITSPFVRTLPYELHLLLCDMLDHTALCAMSGVCRDWNIAMRDDAIWQPLFMRKWDVNKCSSGWISSGETRTWKKQYEERTKVQRCWADGRPSMMTLTGHNGTVTCLAFDDTRLISGSDDGTMNLWSLVKGSAGGNERFPMMQQHHKNSKSSYRIGQFVGHGGPVWCLDFHKDVLVSGSYDKTINVWSVKNQQTKVTLRGHTSWVSSVQLHDQILVSGSWDASLKVWRLSADARGSITGGSCIATLTGDVGNVIYCHQWMPTTGQIMTGCRRQAVQVWDINTARLTETYMGHTNQVYCLQFDHSKIVSGSGDRTIKIWDPRSGQCVTTLTGHANPVMSLHFDDTYKMVSGSYDKTVRVWDMRMSSLLRTLEGHSSAVFTVRMDYDKLISGSADKNVLIWDFNKLQI